MAHRQTAGQLNSTIVQVGTAVNTAQKANAANFQASFGPRTLYTLEIENAVIGGCMGEEFKEHLIQ